MPTLLTLTEVAQLLSLTRTQERSLRNYLEEPDIRNHMEPVGKPAKYLESSVPRFTALIALIGRGEVTPKTTAAQIRRGVDLAALDLDFSFLEVRNEKRDSALSVPSALERIEAEGLPLALSAASDIVSALNALAHEMAEANRLKRIEAPADELLTADEAASILRCSPRAVWRYAKAVRRGRWRRSDVMRAIREMGDSK